MEVADAEAVAVLEAVKTAIEHAPQNSTNLWLCLDNISVVEGINTKVDRIGIVTDDFQPGETKDDENSGDTKGRVNGVRWRSRKPLEQRRS
jgi:hypothetical protein